MRFALSLLLSVCLSFAVPFTLLGSPLQQEGKPAKAQQQNSSPVVKPPLAFGLEDGTPVKLRTNRTVSSSDAHVNDTLDFEVLEEVKVHDVLVIPRGGIAWGTIPKLSRRRRMGREGKLNINIDDVKLSSGKKIPLRAVKEAKGGGHQGAMTGAIVATAIVFFPAAPLFLLIKGKDITIPKGTEITAYINGDVPLDAAKFDPTRRASSQLVLGRRCPLWILSPLRTELTSLSMNDSWEIHLLACVLRLGTTKLS